MPLAPEVIAEIERSVQEAGEGLRLLKYDGLPCVEKDGMVTISLVRDIPFCTVVKWPSEEMPTAERTRGMMNLFIRDQQDHYDRATAVLQEDEKKNVR